jgi:RHS repeat-associated protein
MALFLWVPALAQFILPTETPNGTAAGRSSGSARVGPSGDARYEMPLWVAPGRASMQPSLALAYSSVAGDGPLGVGWALSGLSRITRCARTWLQEGQPASVRFVDGDDGDRYCLDGQRLVLVGGAAGSRPVYGEHESEYRTERDLQVKVVAFQTNALGPLFFRVYQKDGRILTYGGTQDARLKGRMAALRRVQAPGYPPRSMVEATYDRSVIAAWALSRVEDRAGNYLVVRYVVDQIGQGYEQYPVEIAYTGHSGDQPLAPTRLVQFVYGSRPDASEQYSGGLRTVLTRRLTQVQIRDTTLGRNDLVREYRFAYRTATLSRRSLLEHVTECDGVGACLGPTTFQWSEPGPQVQSPRDLGAFSTTNPSPSQTSQAIVHAGDIDGDGRDDLMLRGAGGLVWGRRLSNGSVPGPLLPGPPSEPRDPSAGAQAREAEGRLVDLDADGRADFMVRERPRPGGGVGPPELFRNQVYWATNSGFEQYADPLEPYSRVYRESYVLDLDGDGLPDLVKPAADTSAPAMRWGARRNLGRKFDQWKGSEVGYRAPGPLTFWPVEALAFDIDGRGAQDLIVEFSPHGATALRWDGATLRRLDVPTLLTSCRPLFADVNGDGLIDQLDLDTTRGVVAVAINTGRGFLPTTDWIIAPPFNNSPALQNPGGCTTDYDAGVRVIDFNGDGRDDLLLLGGYLSGGARRLAVLESTHTGFAPRDLGIQVQIDPPTAGGWRTAQALDVNGDGLRDFVTATDGRLLLFARPSVPQDLLLGAVDGVGRYDRFTYKPFLQLHEQGAATECRYPLACTRQGPWLVEQHLADSGIKAERSYSYRYHDGRHDLAGRGWLGFGRVETKDHQTGLHVDERFDNTTRADTFYPCAGFSLSRVSTVLPLETKAASRTHRVAVTRRCEPVLLGAGPARRHFAYAGSTRMVEEELPLTGASTVATKLREVESREARDEFDNVTLAEQLTHPADRYGALGRATMWRLVTQYDNYTASWLIGQPAHVETTRAVRGGRSVVTTIGAQFDAATGLLARLEKAGRTGDIDPARALAVVTTIDRNALGLPVRLAQQDPSGTRAVTLTYDAQQMFVTSIINPQGHKATATHHTGLGVVLSQIDANDIETQLSYDGFGRLRQLSRPSAREVRLSYGKAPGGAMRVTETLRGGIGLTTVYDRLSRVVRHDWRDAAGQPVSIDYQFDVAGRLVGQTPPQRKTPNPSWERIRYDALGRPLEVFHPDGSKSTLEYDGLKVTRIDAQGHKRYVLADELGRVAESGYIVSGGRVVRSRFGYGPAGQLEQVINADSERVAQSFDALGRRMTIDDPNSGITRFSYNGFDDLTQIEFASGLEMGHIPDSLGRVTATSQGRLRFWWDDARHGIGSLSRAENATDATTTEFRYGANGWPEQTTWTINGSSYMVQEEYDGLGRPTHIHYPFIAGTAPPIGVRNVYTPEGRLDRVTDLAGTVVYWQALERDAQERVVAERLGNGIVTRRSYGANDRLRSIRSGPLGGVAIQNLEYAYYPNRNQFRRFDHLTGSMEEFAYDRLDRLTVWDVFQPGVRLMTEYGYDDAGNVMSRTQQLGPDPSRHYRYGEGGAGRHAVTSVLTGATTETYGYDRSGNMVLMPEATLEYNSLNLPAEFKPSSGPRLSFKYDAFGQRVFKRSGATGNQVTLGKWYERRSGAGGELQLFSVRADGRVVAQVVWDSSSGTSQVYYLLHDALGSVDVVTDAGGSVIDYLKYAPFGERVQRRNLGLPGAQPVSPVRLGFTGHLHDDETDLIFAGRRIYAPRLMRFLAPDPLVKDRFDSQAFNRYSYARNNPLTYIDPDGLSPQPTAGPSATNVTFSEGLTITGHYNNPTSAASPAPAATDRSEPAGAPAASYTGGFELRPSVGDDQGTRSLQMPPAVPLVSVAPPSGPVAPPIGSATAPNFVAAPNSAAQAGPAPRFPAHGISIGGGGMMCLLVCFAVVDVHVGMYKTYTPPEGDERESIAFFISMGGGSVWTLPPPPMQSMPEPQPLPLSLGLGMGIGFDGQIFATEAPTFDDFSGYAMGVSGGAGPVTGSVSVNPSNQKTYAVGLGASKGFAAGISSFGSQTWGVTFPGRR